MDVDDLAWVDGALAPLDAVVVPVASSAVFRGTSVFDVLAVTWLDGAPLAVGLGEHVQRFLNSMAAIGMTIAFDRVALEGGIAELVGAHRGLRPGIVRMVAYWPDTPGGALPTSDPVVVITAEPAAPAPPASLRMRCATARIDPRVLPAGLKVAAAYTAGMIAEAAAHRDGFDGIVNTTPDRNWLLEGVSASVGALVGDRWCLPPLDMVLDSVTRRLVADVADACGLTVEVAPVPMEVALRADSLVLSSTTRPFVPIAALDEVGYRVDTVPIRELATTVADALGGGNELSGRWLTALDP